MALAVSSSGSTAVAKYNLQVGVKASVLIPEFPAPIAPHLKQPPGLQNILTLNASWSGVAFCVADPPVLWVCFNLSLQ